MTLKDAAKEAAGWLAIGSSVIAAVRKLFFGKTAAPLDPPKHMRTIAEARRDNAFVDDGTGNVRPARANDAIHPPPLDGAPNPKIPRH